MKEIDYNLLGKILSNEATWEEKAQFHKWLEQSAENEEIYNAYRSFYNNTTITEYNVRHPGSERKVQQLPHSRGSRSLRWGYWAVAASVALLAFFAFFFTDQLDKSSDSQVVENKTISNSNPKGKKSKVLLPDGSVVWLNSNSKIEYFQNFTDSLRLVSLTGEAYFEVTKDSLRPFIVDVGNLQATVLGTSFNVCNYPENESAIVSLASGKLMVKQENNTEILLPGNQIKFYKSSNRLDKSNVEISRIAAWKNGVLIFDQEDFQSVIACLERWYDVEITIDGDPSPQWKFTGYFNNEYLKNVLEVLCYGKNLDYKIEEKDVKLIKK